MKDENEVKNLSSFQKNYVMVANKIIDSLKKRLIVVNQEKETYQALWKSSQETVNSLESEIHQYRNELNQKQPTLLAIVENLKSEYTNELKKLEESTQEQNSNLKHQKLENEKLVKKLQDYHRENENLNQQNIELAEKLKNESESCQEQIKKNQETLEKLEETIDVAEKSMNEIHKLIFEKEQIEDEYNNLAQTIGTVLEETAQKLDTQMELQNVKHQEQILKLEQEILRYQKLLEEESKKTQDVLNKNQLLSKTNSFLDHDLKIAFNVVDEAESKLKTLEKSIEMEQKNSKLCEEQAEHLKFIIQKKNQYKQVYHGMLLEILGMMEKLLAENKKLKGLKR